MGLWFGNKPDQDRQWPEPRREQELVPLHHEFLHQSRELLHHILVPLLSSAHQAREHVR